MLDKDIKTQIKMDLREGQSEQTLAYINLLVSTRL